MLDHPYFLHKKKENYIIYNGVCGWRTVEKKTAKKMEHMKKMNNLQTNGGTFYNQFKKLGAWNEIIFVCKIKFSLFKILKLASNYKVILYAIKNVCKLFNKTE
jgi:hypothetical protein